MRRSLDRPGCHHNSHLGARAKHCALCRARRDHPPTGRREGAARGRGRGRRRRAWDPRRCVGYAGRVLDLEEPRARPAASDGSWTSSRSPPSLARARRSPSENGGAKRRWPGVLGHFFGHRALRSSNARSVMPATGGNPPQTGPREPNAERKPLGKSAIYRGASLHPDD